MRTLLRSLSYKAVLAAGLFMAAAACVYVPFTIEWVNEGENISLSSSAGYAFIWDPPDNMIACKEAFAFGSYSRFFCKVWPNTLHVALTVLAIAFLFAGLLSLLGLPQKSKD